MKIKLEYSWKMFIGIILIGFTLIYLGYKEEWSYLLRITGLFLWTFMAADGLYNFYRGVKYKEWSYTGFGKFSDCILLIALLQISITEYLQENMYFFMYNTFIISCYYLNYGVAWFKLRGDNNETI